MKVNAIGAKGLNLIKQFEGFMAKPYICSGGAKTIGYGATYYPNGLKVTMNDKPIRGTSFYDAYEYAKDL